MGFSRSAVDIEEARTVWESMERPSAAKVVKHFKAAAPFQEAILAAFEAAGWTSCILVERVARNGLSGKNRLATLGGVLVQLPYLILAVVGLIMGFRQDERPIVFCMLLFAAYSIAVCAPIHAEARYSVPLVPPCGS